MINDTFVQDVQNAQSRANGNNVTNSSQVTSSSPATYQVESKSQSQSQSKSESNGNEEDTKLKNNSNVANENKNDDVGNDSNKSNNISDDGDGTNCMTKLSVNAPEFDISEAFEANKSNNDLIQQIILHETINPPLLINNCFIGVGTPQIGCSNLLPFPGASRATPITLVTPLTSLTHFGVGFQQEIPGLINSAQYVMQMQLEQFERNGAPKQNGEIDIPKGPFYCVKVSCVATGNKHNDREIGQISLVDFQLRILANVFVKPKSQVCFIFIICVCCNIFWIICI